MYINLINSFKILPVHYSIETKNIYFFNAYHWVTLPFRIFIELHTFDTLNFFFIFLVIQNDKRKLSFCRENFKFFYIDTKCPKSSLVFLKLLLFWIQWRLTCSKYTKYNALQKFKDKSKLLLLLLINKNKFKKKRNFTITFQKIIWTFTDLSF